MILLLFLYGTKSREKNGPNSQPAQCISPSEFYKNGYIQSIGERLLDFVVVRRFATGDVFVYLQ